MTRYYLMALVGLVSILTIDCKKNKDKEPETFYKAPSTASVGSIKMYTYFGEVTNSATIQDFISRRAYAPNTFVFNSASESFDAASLTLAFRSETSARVERHPVPSSSTIESHTAEVSKVSDSVWLVHEIDSTSAIQPNPATFCSDFYYNIQLFPLQYNCLPSNTSVKQCKYRNRFPIIKKGDSIELPYFVALYYSGSDGCSFHAFGNVWNLTKTNIQGIMNINDTLVIQTRRAVLNKQ